jgi:hypothetical protein
VNSISVKFINVVIHPDPVLSSTAIAFSQDKSGRYEIYVPDITREQVATWAALTLFVINHSVFLIQPGPRMPAFTSSGSDGKFRASATDDCTKMNTLILQ